MAIITIKIIRAPAASHGVHNFLGLDGLLPSEIRKIAWKQINKYDSAEFREEKIVNVNKEDGIFFITSGNETSVKAKKVFLAVGYYDVYPDICTVHPWMTGNVEVT
jgi:thioredoxin reductase